MYLNQIFLKLTHGKTEVLNIKNKMNSGNLKKIINANYGLNLNYMYLIRKTKVLKDTDIINDKDEIIVNLRIKGGFIDVILKLLRSMLKLFKNLGKLIDKIINFFVIVIETIPYIFQPDKLINGIMVGILEGLKLLFLAPFKAFTFGTSKKKKKISKKNRYCIKTRLLKLLILVVCPPLAIFIDSGLKAIIPIIISSILTFFLYYFPGLLFSALYLLN